MDPSALAAPPSGLDAWIATNQAAIQLVLWGSQILFWVGMLIFIGYAVAQYKRWVNYQMGVGKAGQLKAERVAENTDAVSVEEFVE